MEGRGAGGLLRKKKEFGRLKSGAYERVIRGQRDFKSWLSQKKKKMKVHVFQRKVI